MWVINDNCKVKTKRFKANNRTCHLLPFQRTKSSFPFLPFQMRQFCQFFLKGSKLRLLLPILAPSRPLFQLLSRPLQCCKNPQRTRCMMYCACIIHVSATASRQQQLFRLSCLVLLLLVQLLYVDMPRLFSFLSEICLTTCLQSCHPWARWSVPIFSSV